MSGYTPVFKSVFTGSLYGKFPDLPLWLVILAMADKNGEVDAHPAYIAGASGIPVEEVEACIARFCQPDPCSRTQDDDGRRLVPLPDRGFGWAIVNHSVYREKARLMAKSAQEVADGKNAERMRDRRRPPLTASDPLSDSDTNTVSEGAKAPTVRGSKRCPEGFVPDREYALKEIPDLDYEREAQKFKDWEFKTARKDWPACWRTWIGNARDRKQYAKLGAGGIQWQ